MKKFFVCSDIHGRLAFLKSILLKQQGLDGIIIAGDLELESYQITDLVYDLFPGGCSICMVAGNCDRYSPSASLLAEDETFRLSEKHTLLLTHGHRYHVPRTDLLSYKAEETGADVVIFGHTHCPHRSEENGILFLNPGAIRNGQYLILTIDDDENIDTEFH